MSMTEAEMRSAAHRIGEVATALEASDTGDALRDNQAREVAGQHRDRIAQIHSWIERLRGAGSTDACPTMEASVRSFLRYAGCAQ